MGREPRDRMGAPPAPSWAAGPGGRGWRSRHRGWLAAGVGVLVLAGASSPPARALLTRAASGIPDPVAVAAVRDDGAARSAARPGPADHRAGAGVGVRRGPTAERGRGGATGGSPGPHPGVAAPAVPTPGVDPVPAPAAAPPLPVPAPLPDPAERVPLVEVGRIRIPRIGVDEVIREGVQQMVIDAGVAHWPGTPLPGGWGNAVLAGHRSTHTAPFLRLGELVPGDLIELADATGTYRYVVRGLEVVGVDALWIVDQRPGHLLTIFTCHPIGSSAQRLVVRAELTGPSRP